MGQSRFEEIRGQAHDIDSWRVLITGTQPPFQRVEDPAGGDFEGALSRQVLDGISVNLIEIKASQHVIHRTAEHIRSSPEPLYVVMFQIEGDSVFSQAGSSAALAPGDYTVSTSTVPFSWAFEGDFTVLMLRFPQAFIDAPPQSFLPLLGRALRPEDGFGRHLSPFVQSVARDTDLLRGPVGRRVAQNLVDLFTTSFLAHLGAAGEGGGDATPLFQRLTGYISEHLGDAQLDPAGIAAANYISTRYLQAIFQEHGTTVSSWVRERRLAGARREIGDPLLRERPIGEVAERWGFLDQAYFSRVFRQAFGESPKQWRARATRGEAAKDREPTRWTGDEETIPGWM